MRRVLSLACSMCVVILLLTAGMSSLLFSQTASRITQRIDESQLVRLSRNTRPEGKNASFDRGPVADSYIADHMLLVLQRSPEQEQELDKLLEELNDRKSPNFHKWLQPEEFGRRFGASQEDIDTVSSWLELHGFQVNKAYPSHMMIDFSGSAASLKEAFHTEIHQLDVNGEMHLSNDRDPRIPAALAPVIQGIFSLNDFKPEPMYRLATQYTFASCAATSTNTQPGVCNAMTPGDDATIYNLNPLWAAGYTGQGQTIYVAEDSTFNTAADWATYRAEFGLNAYTAGTFTQTNPGSCTNPGSTGAATEAELDGEMATTMAPSAAVNLISCADTVFTTGVLTAVMNQVNTNGAKVGVISVSYGVCEILAGSSGTAAFSNAYQQAVTEGYSVFVSTGDSGAASCAGNGSTDNEYSIGINGWGSSPYNVAVGGTDFEDTFNAKIANQSEGGVTIPVSTYWNATNGTYYNSAKSYVPEIPWNDACSSALISDYLTGSYAPYGASPATCNNASYDTSATFLTTGSGAGGASNCATGVPAEGVTTSYEDTGVYPSCQGWPKPSYQSGSSLNGAVAVYGQPSDAVRDTPDVSMFASNGVWGHYQVVCYTGTLSGTKYACTGAPSAWLGLGGTSVAAPSMAGIQALVNQKTGELWGNPNPIYYQIAQNQYGTAGGSFAGSTCNSSGSGGPASGCAFNDVTQGDMDVPCIYDSTIFEAQCYKPAGTYGVTSTDAVTAASVINGGTGYTTAPTCTIAGPSNSNPYISPSNTTLYAGGVQATCTAAVNAGTTTAVWDLYIEETAPAATWAGYQVTIGATTYTFVTGTPTAANQVELDTSGNTAAKEDGTIANFEAVVNATSSQCTTSGCVYSGQTANSLATATIGASLLEMVLTAKTAGYAGNFTVAYGDIGSGAGSGTYPYAVAILLFNPTTGQGPNYVSGITVTTPGSGYNPDTPVTLTGGGGNGAIAVASTSPGTAASSYQPTWGAAPGYDLATGIGTPNAYYLAYSRAWLPTVSANPTSVTIAQGGSVGTSTITVSNPDAFTSANGVTLSTANLPTGVTSSFTGNPTNTTSTLSLAASASAACGTSTITVNGVSGAAEGSATISLTVTGTPGIDTPANGATLTGSSATFQWCPYAGATNYWLDAGSTLNGNNYEQTGPLPSTTLSQTVNSIPENGSTVYVNFYYSMDGGNTWTTVQYTYTAFGGGSTIGVMTSPTPNSTLSGNTVTFDWSAGSAASAYWIDVGSSAGGNQYFQSGNIGNVLTETVNGIPTNGAAIYVTLYSMVNGQWLGNQYQYTAFNLTAEEAAMQSPTPGSTLPGSTVTFTWSAGSGASAYWIDVGNTSGGSQYLQSGNIGSATSETVNGLPTDGSEVYVTLYSMIGGSWYANPYTYYALSTSGSSLAVMQTPTPGSTLGTSNVTFTWNAGSAATAYWLDLGSTAGANDIYQSGNLGSSLTTTVPSIPANGSTVYATLYSYVDGQWFSNAYTYTETGVEAKTPTPGRR